MRKRKALRLSVDIGMTVLLFVLMAYQLTGQFAHEWAGAVMLVLFAAHHLLNRQWFLSLGKGKYAPLRVIQTAADALLLADMLALMVSGIIMSHYVFAFLPPFGRVSTAWLLHLAASHWGFVLMGVHLGLHWGGMIGMVRGRPGWKPSRLRQVMLWIATAAVGAYGVYAFVTNQFGQYLIYRSSLHSLTSPALHTGSFWNTLRSCGCLPDWLMPRCAFCRPSEKSGWQVGKKTVRCRTVQAMLGRCGADGCSLCRTRAGDQQLAHANCNTNFNA